ncbi:hypothetical protein EH196_19365 [Bacillus sp. C1-1]|nr:hypothetical protein EH196_19365 [Bacillus sp. C1-1]
MDIGLSFRRYLKNYHPELLKEDWYVNQGSLRLDTYLIGAVTTARTSKAGEENCVVFSLKERPERIYIVQTNANKSVILICFWNGEEMEQLLVWEES